MKVLVMVASKHGSTREIAVALAEELRHAGIATDLRAVREEADLTGYDAIILGSAVYAGNWLAEVRQFVERQRATLAGRPLWVFSSGPLGADDPQPHDDPQRLAAPLGDLPIREHRVFVGSLDKDRLGRGERLIVRAGGAPGGDFRDWSAIRSWAQSIATALQPAVAIGV